MLKSLAGAGAAALIALGAALAGSSAANAESVMKQCGDQWQAAKAAGTTNGETWPQFLSQCRAKLKSGTAATPPQRRHLLRRRLHRQRLTARRQPQAG